LGSTSRANENQTLGSNLRVLVPPPTAPTTLQDLVNKPKPGVHFSATKQVQGFCATDAPVEATAAPSILQHADDKDNLGNLDLTPKEYMQVVEAILLRDGRKPPSMSLKLGPGKTLKNFHHWDLLDGQVIYFMDLHSPQDFRLVTPSTKKEDEKIVAKIAVHLEGKKGSPTVLRIAAVKFFHANYHKNWTTFYQRNQTEVDDITGVGKGDDDDDNQMVTVHRSTLDTLGHGFATNAQTASDAIASNERNTAMFLNHQKEEFERNLNHQQEEAERNRKYQQEETERNRKHQQEEAERNRIALREDREALIAAFVGAGMVTAPASARKAPRTVDPSSDFVVPAPRAPATTKKAPRKGKVAATTQEQVFRQLKPGAVLPHNKRHEECKSCRRTFFEGPRNTLCSSHIHLLDEVTEVILPRNSD